MLAAKLGSITVAQVVLVFRHEGRAAEAHTESQGEAIGEVAPSCNKGPQQSSSYQCHGLTTTNSSSGGGEPAST